MPEIPPWMRLDGTLKGPGFDAQWVDGSIMTELSGGSPAYHIPIYPGVYQGILPWEMQTLANVVRYGYDPLQDEVYQRAAQAASERIASGLSPFWTPADGEPSVLGRFELPRRDDWYGR